MVIIEGEEEQKEQAIKIADIKIGSRLRKKLTDIDSLAASIAKVGLLHPPVIDENNKLIAGFRRIKACEKLGWTEIPVRRINIKNAIQGEYDENVERAGFALEDVAAIHEEVQKTRIGHRPAGSIRKRRRRKGVQFGHLNYFILIIPNRLELRSHW